MTVSNLASIKKELAELLAGKITSDKSDEELLSWLSDSKVEKVQLPVKIQTYLDELQEMDSDGNERLKLKIKTLKNLPYGVIAKYNQNILEIEEALNKSHYGMDSAKSVILETLQAAKYRGEVKLPFMCLYGAPGVGKTTFLKAIASALTVPIYFINMTGKSPSNIIGTDFVYKNANVGYIVRGLLESKCMNPIFVFDEVDKLASDDRYGSTSDTLLGICDSSQNNVFRDLFLDVELDISQATFLFTANSIQKIPEALRSRLTMVEIKDYSLFEKFTISKRHILPNKIKEFHLSEMLEISDEAINYLVESLQINEVGEKEGGIREVAKALERMLIKAAAELERNHLNHLLITKEWVIDRLGVSKLEEFRKQINDSFKVKPLKVGRIGTVHSLGVFSEIAGKVGDITCRIIPNGSGAIEFTGQMLDEPQDAAKTAYNFIRANYRCFGIEPHLLSCSDFVIHSHNAAIKKDGASAGVVYVIAMLSEILRRPVSDEVAMSGAVELDGSITPIGGVNFKVEACIQNELKKIYLSKQNQKDVPQEYFKSIDITLVDNLFELISLVFDTFDWHCSLCGEKLFKHQSKTANISWLHPNQSKCTYKHHYQDANGYPQEINEIK